MKEEDYILLNSLQERIKREPIFSLEVFAVILNCLKEYERKTDKKHSYIDLVVKLIKPSAYSSFMNKNLSTEVFETLGLQLPKNRKLK